MLRSAGRLPDAVSRALAVATAYDMLVKGELLLRRRPDVRARRARDRDGAGRGRAVPAAGQPDRGLLHARGPDDRAARAGRRPRRGHRARAGGAAAGALYALAANATTAEHFAQLDAAAADDIGLAWRVAASRAARGDYDPEVVEALEERDPDPDAAMSALIVRRLAQPPRGQGGGLARPVRRPVGARRPGRWAPSSRRSGGPTSATCCCPSRRATSRRSPASPAAACSRCSA